MSSSILASAFVLILISLLLHLSDQMATQQCVVFVNDFCYFFQLSSQPSVYFVFSDHVFLNLCLVRSFYHHCDIEDPIQNQLLLLYSHVQDSCDTDTETIHQG